MRRFHSLICIVLNPIVATGEPVFFDCFNGFTSGITFMPF
jgi:hypothetical protein